MYNTSTNHLCQFCGKPYAYPLPHEQWYRPPINPIAPMTYTAGTTINLTISGNAVNPQDYCYGHTFVLCEDCGMLVPYGFHSPSQCAVLHGLREGIDRLRAWVQRQERTPQQERLPEHIDVPAAFQRAFAEKESL